MSRVETTRAGTPTAIAPGGHVVAHDGAGADDRAVADRDAVENLGAGADPRAVADGDAGRVARLLEHRLRRIGEIVVAADDVAVRRHQHALRRCVTRLAENTSQLKPRLAPSASSMSPFLHDRIVLRPMNTPSPMRMPRLRLALRVEQAVVVDDDVAADVNLVRMAQHDVLAEDDVAAARAEQQRIQRLAQRQPERAGTRLRERSRRART